MVCYLSMCYLMVCYLSVCYLSMCYLNVYYLNMLLMLLKDVLLKYVLLKCVFYFQLKTHYFSNSLTSVVRPLILQMIIVSQLVTMKYTKNHEFSETN